MQFRRRNVTGEEHVIFEKHDFTTHATSTPHNMQKAATKTVFARSHANLHAEKDDRQTHETGLKHLEQELPFMDHIIGAETLEALRALETCDVANAIESFDLRLRNGGYTDPTLHCRSPHLPSMVGYAVTMRVRAASPPMHGHDYLDRTDW